MDYKTYKIGQGKTVITTKPIETVAKEHKGEGFVEEIKKESERKNG